MKQRLQVVVLATAVLLPILAFSSAMVVLFDRQQKETVENMLNHAAAALEDALERELVSNIAGLESLATSIHLDDNDIVNFAVVARRLLESRANWLSLRLLRAGDGTPLLTLPAAGGNADATTTPPPADMVLDAVTARLPMVSEVRHDSRGEPFVSIVVPVLRDGTAVYALSAALRSRALSAALGGPKMPAGWFGAALDTDRVILARTRRQEEFVGKPVTESLRQRIDQGDKSFFFARNKEGEEVYTAFVTSPLTGWTVVVGAPGETVAGPMRRSLMAVTGGGLLALAATVWLGALLVGNANRRHAMERRLLALEGERMAERRLADVAANLPGVIFRRVRDPNGTVRYPYLSAGLNNLAGGMPEAPPGADELELLIHPEDRDGWREIFRPAGGGQAPAPEKTPLEPRHLEARIGPTAGPVRWVRVMARPALTGENETAWDGVALDVTDLKETQHRLATSLAESQELLQEVHHRVKNNLQVVWSLIQLEAMQIEDQEARDRMEIIGQRIGVMGRIHEQVYASKEFSRIDFGRQLRGLCDALASTFGNPPGVNLEVAGDALFCHLDTAIPLGLIANELVANAFKHAFPEGAGTIRVSLRARGDEAVLEVSDDGVGMSGANTDRGLGLRLIKGLLRQIGATMQTGPAKGGTGAGTADAGGGNGGTHVTISIPGPWYAR